MAPRGPVITFPGHGDPGPGCGVEMLFGCSDSKCKKYFTAPHACKRKTCPDCYPKWALDQGERAAERMTEFLKSKDHMRRLQLAERRRWEDALSDDESTVEQRKLYRIQTYHIQISFIGQSISSWSDITELREVARDIGRKHGLFGECTIPHQRFQDDEGRAHFHFLGLAGYIAPGGGDGTDYIFKVIQFEGQWHQRNLLDRLNVVKYACTHALVDEFHHTVTWSGCVANNKFSGVAKVDRLRFKGPTCPHCGGTETFKVYDHDWYFNEEVETWTAPDRPPPDHPQRALTQFV